MSVIWSAINDRVMRYIEKKNTRYDCQTVYRSGGAGDAGALWAGGRHSDRGVVLCRCHRDAAGGGGLPCGAQPFRHAVQPCVGGLGAGATD